MHGILFLDSIREFFINVRLTNCYTQAMPVQLPSDVVEEVLRGLGKREVVVTGITNKVAELVFKIIPTGVRNSPHFSRTRMSRRRLLMQITEIWKGNSCLVCLVC